MWLHDKLMGGKPKHVRAFSLEKCMHSQNPIPQSTGLLLLSTVGSMMMSTLYHASVLKDVTMTLLTIKHPLHSSCFVAFCLDSQFELWENGWLENWLFTPSQP